jgi:hypothetical protein
MSLSKIFHHPVTLALMFLLGAGLIGAGEWMMGPARISLAGEERKRMEQLSLLQTQQKEVTPTDWNDLKSRWQKILPVTVPNNQAVMEQVRAIEALMKKSGWLGKLTPAEAGPLLKELPDLQQSRIEFELTLPQAVVIRNPKGSQEILLEFLRALEMAGGRRPLLTRLEVKLNQEGELQASGSLMYFRIRPDVEFTE